MRKLLVYCLLACATPVFMAASCNKNEVKDPCAANVICTEIFKMVTVQVKDADGNDQSFDDYFTLRKSNQEIIRSNEGNAMEGRFIVLDDSYRSKLANKKDTFLFVAIRDGKEVISEPFVIGADCCHIDKVSGKDVITMR